MDNQTTIFGVCSLVQVAEFTFLFFNLFFVFFNRDSRRLNNLCKGMMLHEKEEGKIENYIPIQAIQKDIFQSNTYSKTSTSSILMLSQGFRRSSKYIFKSQFLYFIQHIQVAIRSTSPHMHSL